ncbi:hypothetical protein H696_03222 [Fonticula alba]|uniref:Uncharacterized protein n=1 Tax=Fonticula alba TaxID=691883 RepID=A0A058ZBR1_FONAL|nr:hypothetical protein H696_03222 [Fonticula alba]KCV70867.1 hypothetical protein H696_03222 [Fonticula alba]|eukprot:XP_009495383.1 hypothetical protein H696_03222 [Fonticula alba]
MEGSLFTIQSADYPHDSQVSFDPSIADFDTPSEGSIRLPRIFSLTESARGNQEQPPSPDVPSPPPSSLPAKDEAPFRNACFEADSNAEVLASLDTLICAEGGLLMRDGRIWIPQARPPMQPLQAQELFICASLSGQHPTETLRAAGR